MLTDGVRLLEGSSITNAVVASGISFPASPNEGELFFRSDVSVTVRGLHVYVGGTWDRIASTDSLSAPNGAVLPALANAGDLFYLNTNDSNEGLYVYSGSAWVATAAGAGTVTSVSIVPANGFAGTVASSSSTPAITISTSVSGVLKGNGTAISAATVGTDYSVGTSALGTGILRNTTGTGALSIAVAANFPTLNQNTTGTAATVTAAAQPAITSVGTLTSLAVTGNITADEPTISSHVATKLYVDSLVQGLTWKTAARVTTTANITLSGLQTIDGIAVVADNRVLVKNQSIPSQNGVYVVAAGSWTRAVDMDGAPSVGEVNGAAVYITDGTTLADTTWSQTADVVTMGSDALTFVQLSGSGSTNASSLVGNTLAAGVIASSLTSVGTIGTGTWQGTTIGALYGGTGHNSYTVGDLLYASSSSALSKLTSGTAGQVLRANGISAAPSWAAASTGTVTSVGLTVPTGFAISGSPVTTSGSLALSFDPLYSLPTIASQTNWNTAFTNNLQWNGGATSLVAGTGRTSLGATTVGSNLFTLSNPGSISFLRVNLDNSVSSLDAASFRTAIGAGSSSTTGTVTSVAGTGTVSGISLSGTVTSTGSLTLGGTLAVTASNFSSQAANTVLVAPNSVAGTPTFRVLVPADVPTLNQNTTGTASALTTARTINGVSFDGSANIVVTAAAGTLTGASLASNVLSSSLTSVGTLTSLAVTGAVTASTMIVGSQGQLSAATLTTSVVTANQVIITHASATYRSVRYQIQATSGSAYEILEINAIHDGTNAYITEFGRVATGASLGTFDTDVASGQLRLLVTPANAVSTFKVIASAIII